MRDRSCTRFLKRLGVGPGRRFEGEPAPGVEVERLRLGLARRPDVVLPPLVRPGLEDVRLGEFRGPFALEVELFGDGELDVLAVEDRRLGVEADLPEPLAVAPAPAAVRPRACDQDVRSTLAVRLDGLIGLQGAEEILGVEPAADRHHRRADVLQMRPQVPGLPELVVSAVPHQLVPERHLSLEMNLVGFALGGPRLEGRTCIRRACRGRTFP